MMTYKPKQKAYIGASLSNATGDVVAVSDAQQAIDQQSVKQCDWFHRTFRLKGCSPADKPATAVDTTSGSSTALDPNFSIGSLNLPDLGSYTAPSIGVKVGQNDASTTDDQGLPVDASAKKDYSWYIIGALALAVIVFFILYLRAKKQGK